MICINTSSLDVLYIVVMPVMLWLNKSINIQNNVRSCHPYCTFTSVDFEALRLSARATTILYVALHCFCQMWHTQYLRWEDQGLVGLHLHLHCCMILYYQLTLHLTGCNFFFLFSVRQKTHNSSQLKPHVAWERKVYVNNIWHTHTHTKEKRDKFRYRQNHTSVTQVMYTATW